MSSSSSLVVVLPAADRTQEHVTLGRHACARVCWERRGLTDLQLPLDAVLAAVAVLGLRGVVLSHHLHELTRQRRVLRHKTHVWSQDIFLILILTQQKLSDWAPWSRDLSHLCLTDPEVS